MKYYNSSLKLFGLITCITAVLLLSGLIFPLGWIDDIYINNILLGIYSKDFSSDLLIRYYVIIGDLIIYLNSLFPYLSWYLIFILISISFILFLITKILVLIFGNIITTKNYTLIFILMIFLVFFSVELFLLPTFTVLSILIVSLSFLYFILSKKQQLLFLVVPVFFGALIRTDVILFLLPLLLYHFFAIKKKYFTFFLFSILLALPFILEKFNYKKNVESLKIKIILIHNVLDANNANNFSSMIKVDSARTFAFFTWYQGDFEKLFNLNYKESLESHSPFSSKTIAKAPKKLKLEYHKACCRYPDEYTPFRNWFNKAMISLVILLFLSIYFFNYQNIKKIKWINILLPLTFVLLILATTILFKMEYRVYYPLYITTLLILFSLNKNIITQKFIKVSSMLLIILIPFRIIEFTTTSKHLRKEHQDKKKFRNELNSKFENKLIFFDFLTSSLNSPSLINNKPFNEGKNTLLLYGEVFSNFDTNHLNYLEEICGSHEIVPFFKCLYANKENVVFAFTSLRVKMYEAYFKQIYNLNVKFKKLENKKNALNSIKYSYVWEPIQADYYIFDTSFNDFNEK